MTDFLLELRSEEIPARMQVQAKADLARLFTTELAKHGLSASAVETFATPRRLALIARDLPDATAAQSEELKGPRTSAPPQALDGFLRKTGLTRHQLTERDGVWFATLDKPGQPTADVLATVIPTLVRHFPWPKSMRWGAASDSMSSLRWVRPLQGIVAIFGTELVPLEADGIASASGYATLGHRFHHPGPITLGGAHDYVEKLRACHVIVHYSERCALIRDGARAAASAAGLTLVADEGLVSENAGLTEWPVPLLGRFDESYLDVPPEVIQLTMRTNQKYFACAGVDGKLANAFVLTSNIAASDGGAAIIAGNQRVLAARLADAKFFWENDLRVPLEEQAKKLGQIVFHEKLGTVADKVDRVAKLASWLVEEGIVGVGPSTTLGTNGQGVQQELANLAERAAQLCKADLVTGMVQEFPELQGIIGGHLARAQGEDPRVADAIRDHYKPVGQGDDVPTDPVTVAVSLADKLDTIVGFFAILEKPSGSRDPFAIRRAAINSIQIALKSELRYELRAVIVRHKRNYWEQARSSAVKIADQALADSRARVGFVECLTRFRFGTDNVIPWTAAHFDAVDLPKVEAVVDRLLAFNEHYEVNDEIINFFADRLKVQQREAGVRHDLIDAVFALGGEDDLVRLLARVRALQAFVETGEGEDLLAGYKRAANILKKEGWQPSPLSGEGGERSEPGEGYPASDNVPSLNAAHRPLPQAGEGSYETLSYSPEPAETALIDSLDAAEPRAARAIADEDFAAAMHALASLRTPIDAFFEQVTVNDADPAKRAARLALLARFRDAVHRVADFSKIEG